MKKCSKLKNKVCSKKKTEDTITETEDEELDAPSPPK